ncbi:beta-1,6-galactofuranosyltransferase [Flagellimonas sp. 389]|uniref:beta-1,6-galactofuranosyltransferase n=1 Tax=Flagellimonas sp. 389 TaxID=2835862 RepID=UPI001BD5915E|nr:beta-1,6-galactofuranosyltransferase [Flagellimonas sp. 389]MBS9461554.1 beta-1,6-galactofuranosyltransferase [Flagellimonas sp. 389]
MQSKNLFYISRNYKFSRNAASKPKMDCETVLTKMGFKNLGFKQSNHPSSAIGAVISFFGIMKGLIRLPNRSVFCMQYPLSKFFNLVVFFASLKKCTLIIIVHDVKFLMGKRKDAAGEIRKFNKADYLIVHNESMKKWFEENACKARMVTNDIFDYIHTMTKEIHQNDTTPTEVVFAGGLGKEKSEFLYSADNLGHKNYVLKLYGGGFNKEAVDSSSSILSYQGVFSPDKVISEISGSFGLVWNGNSIDGCSGEFGKYLQYNNPHKTSLYLLCGLPVIIWKKAAMAKFIEKENLGLTIDSLSDLESTLNQLSNEDYSKIIKNVKIARTKIAEGHYLKAAMEKVLQLHFDNT